MPMTEAEEAECKAYEQKMRRNWNMPNESEYPTDDTHAIMSAEMFKKFHHYNCSMPTGVWAGKRWIRDEREFKISHKVLLLEWVVAKTDNSKLQLVAREVIIV